MRYAIGIDFGGTKIEACLINMRGSIIDSVRLLTDAKGGKKKVLSNICSAIDIIKERNKSVKIEGIGIGIPGFCDDAGKIVLMPNVPLVNFNISNYLNKIYSCPIFVDNDANCFTYGEYAFAPGKKPRVLLGITIGTGLGCGVIIDGKILSGSNGGAGEIGHNLFDMSAKKLIVGANDFESVLSGPNISRIFSKASAQNEPVHPNKIFQSKTILSKRVVSEVYRHLGILIGTLVNTLNPDKIVLGGAVSKVLIPKKIKKEIVNFSIAHSARKLEVTRSKSHDVSSVLGAAALVFNKYNM